MASLCEMTHKSCKYSPIFKDLKNYGLAARGEKKGGKEFSVSLLLVLNRTIFWNVIVKIRKVLLKCNKK